MTGTSVRRKKSRKNATINILRNKRKRKNIVKPYIGDKTLEQHWDTKKTLQENMRELGLAYNPNTSQKNKKLRKNDLLQLLMEGKEQMDVVKVEVKPKTAVIEEFEKQAANGKKFERHISPDEAKFFLTLIKTHGTNYTGMSADKRNTYQHTANQLRHKCEGLLSSTLLQKYQEMFPELTSDAQQEMETIT